VTTVIADPHEIANVCGAEGVQFMAGASRGLPLRVVLMAPSSVPATEMATNGAKLTAADMAKLDSVHGLGEVMNFPGIIAGDAEALAKIEHFRDRRRPIDGHAPGVSGRALNAYIAAGIQTDHECTNVREAREKLSRGLYVLIREATNARDLRALLPLITPENSRRICFCTDDRQPADLLEHGTIDLMVREAIEYGVEPIDAIRMATLNAAECYGLNDRGAIAPGRLADLFIFDGLRSLRAEAVVGNGKLVTHRGQARFEAPTVPLPPAVRSKCDVRWESVNLNIAAKSNLVRVIGATDGQLITKSRSLDLPSLNGTLTADPSRDVLKMAVIERHHGTGRCGVGFIQGIGLPRGAIAGTVAHDHHNLVVIGADDESMMTAARAVAEVGGGLAVAIGARVLSLLPLPVAGLMSDQPIEVVRKQYDALLNAAKSLGSVSADPFMAMSFMALEVIPALKLTDRGLVDVEKFEVVDLYV
jgi:adenine deaminase